MKFKKSLSLLLSISMLSGLSIASYAAEEPIILLAGSDFQSNYKTTEKEHFDRAVTKFTACIDNAISKGVTKADGLLFAGDYYISSTYNTENGITKIKEILDSKYTTMDENNMVFAQGETDTASNSIAPSGENDPKSGAYGVFVINADDFGNVDTDESKIKQTAQNLIDYLNDKLAQSWKKPIFIVSHNGLHYSMQTKKQGDAIHSKYIFDALNAAGQKGLNIFFLFGKSHDDAWDDYIGGGSVCLKKNDSILIPDHSKDAFSTHTLAFTYLNAGYVGSYVDRNTGANGSLSITAYTITDNDVTLNRYGSGSTIINLKAKGVKNSYANTTYGVTESYSPNTTVYASPQTVTLTDVTDTTPIPNLIEPVESEFVSKDYAHVGDGFGVALKVNTGDVKSVSFNVNGANYPASLYNGNWVAYVPGIQAAGSYTITASITDNYAQTTEKTQTFTVYDKATVIGAEYRIKLYRGNGAMWTLSSTSDYELYYTNSAVVSSLYSIIDISSITNKDLIEKAYFVTSTGYNSKGANDSTKFVIEECAEFTSTTFKAGEAPGSLLPEIVKTAAEGAYSATKVTSSDIDYNILASKVPVKSGSTAKYIKLDATEYIKGKIGNATKLHLRTSVRNVDGGAFAEAQNNAEVKLYIKYKDLDTIDNYDGTTSYVVDARDYGKNTVLSIAAKINGNGLQLIDSCNEAQRKVYRYTDGESNPTIFVWNNINDIYPLRTPIFVK